MNNLTVKLSRNLRRQILRGHPWVYKEALQREKSPKEAQLCKLVDQKGQSLAWGILDPHSPLAVRVLSLEKRAPDSDEFQNRFHKAHDLRKNFIPQNTTAYRLFNGEGDLLPGLICDLYDKVAVMQFDGQGPREFWPAEEVASWITENTSAESVLLKPRRNTKDEPKIWGAMAGEGISPEQLILTVQENGAKFLVDVLNGQKTGFFLDQRENRAYVKSFSCNKRALNLFSYSGGFSIYAGLGGAKSVTSVDIAQGAIDLANKNWALNDLQPEQHVGVCADVFEFLNQTKSSGELFDLIVVDPPSMAPKESQREQAMTAYQELFTAAAKRLTENGHLFLSSCSSHISFEDFFEIINESLSKARRKGQILKISGQGADHPFPHICHELRYLKFAHIVLD